MEDFPVINNIQVVLYRSEFSTGIILDEQYIYYKNNSDQKVYTVFNSIEDALVYANASLKKHINIEFTILDSAKRLLKYIHKE